MKRAGTVRAGRRPHVDLLDTESPIKRFLRRNLVGAAGLFVIGLAAAMAAALATWSVNDPSLNHATGQPVQNALGTPGAIVADLLMQTIGLATAVFLVPVVLWGWRLMSGQALGIGRKRVFAWFGGTALGAGALAALPIPSSWPLPTGLGGFFGDTVHAIPAALTSNLTEGAATIVGVLGLGLPACFLLISASGIFARKAVADDWVDPRMERTPSKGRAAHDDYDFDEDEDDERESRLALLAQSALGWASHWALLTFALLRKLVGLSPRHRVREDVEVYDEDYGDEDAEYDDHDHDLYAEQEPPRRESRLTALRRAIADRLMPKEEDGLEDYYDEPYPAGRRTSADHTPGDGFYEPEAAFEDEGDTFAPDDLLIDKGPVEGQPPVPVGIAGPKPAAAPAAAPVQGRVVPPAPRPKPGKRMVQESQPSFLGAP